MKIYLKKINITPFRDMAGLFFYSLEPDKTFNMMQKYEWKTEEPLDFYNAGASLCEEENFDEAMQNFEKAESMGCNRPELFYNMALIHEEKKEKSKAKQYFQKYIDSSEQWDDIPKSLQLELDEVRDHIKNIQSPTATSENFDDNEIPTTDDE